MGKAADANCLQIRMLNRGKGPPCTACAAIDRRGYSSHMKHVLERQGGLAPIQAQITEWLARGRQRRLKTNPKPFTPPVVILATGTFLAGVSMRRRRL